MEAFYAQKVRGGYLLVKVPLEPALGDVITVALVMPNGLVFAIDGAVVKIGAADTLGKFPVAMRLHGLTDEVKRRMDRIVADGRAGGQSGAHEMPPPSSVSPMGAPGPADAPVDEEVEAAPEPRLEDVVAGERELFIDLEATRKRLFELGAHEILGVASDADLRAVRAAYFVLAKKHHPDFYARHRSPAVRLLAEEVFLHINRAYDRLRDARAAKGASLPGPARRETVGWLAEIEDVQAVDSPLAPAGFAAPASPPSDERDDTPFDSARMRAALTAEDLFGDSPSPPPKNKQTGESPLDRLATEIGRAEAEKRQPSPIKLPPLPHKAASATPQDQGEALARAGKESFAQERWEEARTRLAEALKIDPRNRPLRALYHVASGMGLRVRGLGAEATLHFEAALGHDPGCVEARRALARDLPPEDEKKGGIFRRIFDR